MIFSKIIFLLLIYTIPQCLVQQIFQNKYSYCTFVNNEVPKNELILNIENIIWDIASTTRDKDTHVKFSLCSTLPQNAQCDSNAIVCISNPKKPTKNVRNAGEYFQYVVDNGKSFLRSVNGQKCDDGAENFTVIIQFDTSSEATIKPKIIFMDECELRMEMLWPKHTPICTTRESGNLIDLRPLKQLPNFFVYEPERKKNYSLSFCKNSLSCGQGVSVCDITNNEPIPISSTEYTRVTYDEHHGLVIKGRYGERRQRRLFELHLKCKWKTDRITNIIALPSPGRTHRFKAESSLACIKFPTNCLVRDKFAPQWLYDLSTLSKNYEVRNVSIGTIKINVCNPLTLPRGRNDCTDQYSQVCFQNNTNEMKSFGTVPKNFMVTTDNTVKGSFEEGSICAVNTNFTYTTEIEFICNFVEKGPILDTINNCTYKIKWFTPAACPINSPEQDNCVVQDATGTVNLQKMHKTKDRQSLLSQSAILRYNLCGTLTVPCGNITDASVCYVEGRNERVVGISNKRLFIENNVITLNMVGDKFKNDVCSTKIKFNCNQMIESNQERIQVTIVKDKCIFEISVNTPMACGSSSISNCTFLNHNLLYDLNGISKKNDNYLITKNNKLFLLNACRSVIKRGDALCPPYSGICMKDLNEPHLQYRYKSLGRINEDLVPTFDNNDMIFTYTQGSYCAESDSLDRTSKIRFQCSKLEEGPKLVLEKACNHEFLWRTPSACPTRQTLMTSRSVNNSCHYLNTISGKTLDLSSIKDVLKIRTNVNNSFELDLCSTNYLECQNASESSCSQKNAAVQLVSNATHMFLAYKLDHDCYLDKYANRVHIHLMCGEFSDVWEVLDVRSCILNVNLKTKVVCEKSTTISHIKEVPQEIFRADENSKTNNVLPERNSNIQLESNIEHESCMNTNMQSFNVSILKNIEIKTTTSAIYKLNFEHIESFCQGLVCKDDVNILPYMTMKCPLVVYNYTNSFVLMQYKRISCGFSTDASFIEIQLKCNLELEAPSIYEESECNIVIQYPTSEVCSFFNLKIASADSSGVVIGTSIGFVAAFAFICGFICYRKRWKRNEVYNSISRDKERTRIYTKNTQD